MEGLTRQVKEIYQKFGYSQFKMNKFEEYDTYVKNKDFLISDKVITFTDTNGKLLAMKPDVTISIIKNTEDAPSFVQKVFYNENVYRVTDSLTGFKEIMQTGLECIGDTQPYDVCEVILLAAKSLETISENYVLDISHMGLVTALIKAASLESCADRVLKAISEKNMPELLKICDECGTEDNWKNVIALLISLYAPISEIGDKLSALAVNDETKAVIDELYSIFRVIEEGGAADRVCIDFSVVNDMNYYNGIVFRGYIDGVPQGVLSGGQYDRLMAKMGKKSKAIGFAIYMDMLQRLFMQSKEFDADVLLCYEKGTPAINVYKAAEEIINSGKSVIVQRGGEKVRCRESVTLTKEGVRR